MRLRRRPTCPCRTPGCWSLTGPPSLGRGRRRVVGAAAALGRTPIARLRQSRRMPRTASATPCRTACSAPPRTARR
eukprot:13587583-Alexandrium_andersonii.AAC.1